ncbi:MAG: CRTAC1 family protein [Anaerolineae bacterium]|nr:CRTAC1 family protein [Anaerolineae bacterium]
MFIDHTHLLRDNPSQLNYGIAVTDIDFDGAFEIVVAGYGCPNLVLKWDGSRLHDVATNGIADPERQAIGVAACDLDGDGREEIYILNTDTFAGQKRFADRLLDYADGEWTDLFSLRSNRSVLNLTAGRSVIAVDRYAKGSYGFFVANYGGPLRLYELDEDGHLYDAAPAAHIDLLTGGRSAIALPLISERMDIFTGNEGGANFLFCSRGDGTYEELAHELGVDDPLNNARGVTALDANDDGSFDLVCGNWEGTHRLFIRQPNGHFEDAAPPEMALPSRVRTVVAADFDNDGYEEIFFNNIGQPNRLFARRSGRWQQVDPGDALEPFGLGTGAAVGDFDQDGCLELLVAHGESGAQPLTLYRATEAARNHWLRVLPLTASGAPARGALVVLETAGRTQRRVIDAGSGYLCQMEPVSHFGLGAQTQVSRARVHWTDGEMVMIHNPPLDRLLRVPHP